MSLVEKDAGSVDTIRSNEPDSADFKFIPKALAEKCRLLVEACHAMPHYPRLPDLMWQGHTRDFIELNGTLLQIFKKASVSRSAKKADQGYRIIATVVLALEVLARDYAGWGARFPFAKRKATALIGEFRPTAHSWLINIYLYPRGRAGVALASVLTPTDKPDFAA